jgi:hypothetical protein
MNIRTRIAALLLAIATVLGLGLATGPAATAVYGNSVDVLPGSYSILVKKMNGYNASISQYSTPVRDVDFIYVPVNVCYSINPGGIVCGGKYGKHHKLWYTRSYTVTTNFA